MPNYYNKDMAQIQMIFLKLSITILFDTLRGFLMKLSKKKHDESANTIHKMTSRMGWNIDRIIRF